MYDVEAGASPTRDWYEPCVCRSWGSELEQYAFGRSMAGLSSDVRAEALREVVDGLGRRFGLLDADEDLTLQA